MKMKKPGFTLMEMVIVLAITGIILGVVTSIFITGNRVFSDSDIKTSLQMEARDIQEELTTISIQAVGVNNIRIGSSNKDAGGNLYVNEKYADLESKDINEIQIQAYNRNSEYSKDASGNENITNLQTHNIVFRDGTLSIGSRVLSRNVQSFNVVPQDENNSFANAYSIEFNMMLHEERGFTNVDYPINLRVNFRNKN